MSAPLALVLVCNRRYCLDLSIRLAEVPFGSDQSMWTVIMVIWVAEMLQTAQDYTCRVAMSVVSSVQLHGSIQWHMPVNA